MVREDRIKNTFKDDDIAIIGISTRMPEADTLSDFWRNLINSRESVRNISESRVRELEEMTGEDLQNSEFIKCGYLDNVTLFEPEIYGLSKEEAKILDPQQRLLLELVEEAVLDAGYNPEDLAGKKIGVFIADSPNRYTPAIASFSPMVFTNLSSASGAGRVAYTYNFCGPVTTVGTACSSSVVALHQGCQSLLFGEAEGVLVGGTNINIFPLETKDLEKLPIASLDQQVRAFDKDANGTIGGEGGGLVYLKLLKNALADGDNIHAIIKGSAVNSNGGRSNSMSAPSEDGQKDVILDTISKAVIDPKTISYIETHGTGTNIGDPIEIAGITQAFNELGYAPQTIAIGSLKTNIGHLDGAAGIANIIKVVLALKNKKIPASLNFEHPNPLIKFENSPVYVNDSLVDWECDTVRRAGVTSLGLTGTNVHIIVEEVLSIARESKSEPQIVTLSARTTESLHKMVQQLKDHLMTNQQINIKDLAVTLNTGRRNYRHKFVTIAKDVSELLSTLKSYHEDVAESDSYSVFTSNKNATLRSCVIIPDLMDVDFLEYEKLYANEANFQRHFDQYANKLTNPEDLANPKVKYALYFCAYAGLLESYSLTPDAVIGFGAGNYLANFLSEEISFKECIEEIKSYAGDKLGIPEDRLTAFLDNIVETGINNFILISGKKELTEIFENVLVKKEGIGFIALDNLIYTFYTGIINLMKAGHEVDFKQVYEGQEFVRVSLPGYSFLLKSYFSKLSRGGKIIVERDSAQLELAETSDLINTLTWAREDLKKDATTEFARGTWLVVHDTLGIGQKLKEKLVETGCQVIDIFSGETTARVNPDQYTVVLGSEKDIAQMVEMVAKEHRELTGVINLMNCYLSNQQNSLDYLSGLSERLEAGPYSKFYLDKALIKYYRKLKLYCITTNAHRVLAEDSLTHPENRMLWPLQKVLNQEQKDYSAFIVDVDLSDSTMGQISQKIFEEIQHNQGEIFEIAYRQGQRYIQYLDRVQLNPVKQNVVIRTNGVYIVTGGLGGIALELCKYMASIKPINLILINRSKFSAKGNEEKVQIIEQLQKKGTKVEIISGDVADFARMKEIIEKVKKDYGKIDGVIHAAGVAGNLSLIKSAQKDDFLQVIRAKINGTLVLERLLRDQILDFFVVCSSLSSSMGGQGYGLYASANAFMDSFSLLQRQLGKNYISINWGGWSEIGIAKGVESSTGLIGLKNIDGVRAFDLILKHRLDNIWVAILSEKIKEVYAEFKFFKLRDIVEEKGLNIDISEESLYDTLKLFLEDVYTGDDELTLDKKIMDLDLDSIDIMQFAGKIKKMFKIELSLKLFFEEITVEELFAMILEAVGGSTEGEEIPKQPKQDYYPVSAAQKRLLILNQFDREATNYNIFGGITIKGNLDVNKLRNAIQGVVNRHEAFRTYLDFVGVEPVQRIVDHLSFDLEQFEVDDEEKIDEIVAKLITPFDLHQVPLLRVGLIKLGVDKYIFIFNMHHIISDAISMEIFVRDIFDLYQGKQLKELRIQYKDFSVWQNEILKSVKSQEEYWLAQFKNDIPVLNMPTDYPRPSEMDYEGDLVKFELDKELTDRLYQLITEQGVTLYMALLASFNLLLAKYSGQDDIVVASPIAGRRHADLEEIVGVFVNTLAMRNYPADQKRFLEFLQEVKQDCLQAYDNQDYQFEMLVDKLNLERNLSRNPLFDVMFILQNAGDFAFNFEGLQITPYEPKMNTSQFDLTLECYEAKESLVVAVRYACKLFKSETIERMMVHWTNILKTVLDNPEIKIADIEMISLEEREQLLVEFNNTQTDYPKDMTIYQLFEKQVKRTPDNIAIEYNDQQLTYRQLNEKTNQLARRLRLLGVKPDTIVAIMVERSLEMTIGIFAIEKAGGAYLPINPQYPKDRIEYMLENSQTDILLTQDRFMSWVDFEGVVLNLEDRDLYQGEVTNLELVNTSRDMAYVIYTSGSTGKPKGVMIEHWTLINRLNWMQKEYPIGEGDVILQKTPFVFDVSVWEMFWWSLHGSKLAYLTPDDEKNPEALVEAIEKYKVTTIHFVPSMLNIFLEYLDILSDMKKLRTLKQVFASGEALHSQIVNKYNKYLYAENKTKLHNLYGPTEATIDVSYFDCSTGEEHRLIPIGKPIDNIQLLVLDKNLKVQPIGIPGELCISGDGLARGYLYRPELTSEKFVPNPYCPEERLYKTGDLVRWLSDGNIEYLGRIDRQVKIRGVRIELGEIEEALLNHEKIKETAVIDWADKSGNKYLAAYYVSDAELSVTELRKYLVSILPEYMIPAYFIWLEKLPLSTNGKLNYKKLPEQEGVAKTDIEYLAPVTEIEKRMAKIWAEVLGTEQVGLADNFFELGGDSIKAIQIANKNREEDVILTIKDIFKHKTISNLLMNVDYQKESYQISQEEITGEVLLTPIQHYFFEQNLIHYHYFNQTNLFTLREDVDLALLEQTFNRLIEHHDILRMNYQILEDKPVQTISSNGKNVFKLKTFDLSDFTYEEQQKKLQEISIKVQEDLSVETDLLIQGVVFDLGKNDKRLLIPIHHLVVDGVSWRILLEDLETQYNSNLQTKLPLKTTSFKEWSQRLVNYAQSEEIEIGYWNQIDLEKITSISKNQGEPNYFKDFTLLLIQLDKIQTEQLLTKTSAGYNTGINDILLSGLTLAFSEAFDLEQILLNTEGHGREEIFPEVNLGRTVGWFTSLYPVYFEKQTGIEDTIKYVKESLRRIPNKGLNFGLARYLKNNPYLKNFKSEVCFNYLGQFADEFSQNDVTGRLLRGASESSGSSTHGQNEHPYLIEINGLIIDGKLQFSLLYNQKLVDIDKMRKLHKLYGKYLQEIIEHCVSKKDITYTPSDLNLENTLSVEEFDYIAELVDINESRIYPLTPMQEGMYFFYNFEEESKSYYQQLSFYMEGEVRIELLKEAWQEVINHYDIFRTSFLWENLKNPVQIVAKYKEAEINFIEVIDSDLAELESINQYKEADLAKGFDFTQGKLNRLSIVNLSKDRYWLCWSFHHILLDGWSLPRIMGRFMTIYNCLLTGMQLPAKPITQFAAYLEWWQRQDMNKARKFWESYMNDFTEPTPLPYDKKTEKGQTFSRAKRVEVDLGTERTRVIEEFCKTNQITVNVFIQTIWGVLLQKYNNTNISCFGMTVSGRPANLPDVEEIVGLLINTLPVLIKTDKEMTFKELFSQLNEELIEIRDYEYISLAEIQKMNNQVGDLFDSIIVFENYPVSSAVKDDSLDFRIKFDSVFEQTNYDFSICVVNTDRLVLTLSYNVELFTSETIKRIKEGILYLIDTVVVSPEIKVSGLSVISRTEKKKLLFEFNNTTVEYQQEKIISQLFEEQVLKTPDNIAVVFGDDLKITYRELNEKANQVARLLREKGVKSDQIIGVILDRSIEMIVTFLGVLKAGSAYLPIDHEYPVNRIEFTLEDSDAKLLVTQPELMGKVSFSGEVIDITDQRIFTAKTGNLETFNKSTDLVYIIYTSGTTGKPKGVMIEHIGLSNLQQLFKEEFGVTERARVIQFASCAFDASVWEIYMALLCGGSLYIPTKEVINDYQEMEEYINRHQLTIVSLPPIYLSNLNPDNLSSLKTVITAGSATNFELVYKWKDKVHYINGYGPTETTVCTSLWHYQDGLEKYNTVPIGKPIYNTKVYILDKNLNMVPIGGIGELCVHSVGLARGYQNRPDITAEKFIDNPHRPGERIYRTGDLARWLGDGNLEFLGRIDQQVKIRGFRIELGEIESQLRNHDEISETVVIDRVDTEGNKYLCAYIISETDLSVANLCDYLLRELPEFMIPTYFIQINEIPLTFNGKVDRRALPAPDGNIITSGEYVAPRNEIEEKLVTLWAEILQIKNIGVNDKFFEIGGNSLKIMRLTSLINKEFNTNLKVTELFKYTTISEMATLLGADEVVKEEELEDEDALVFAFPE
ncbi:MAG: amino acid adenylation domain-containing protein [Halanaerobiales bacterium]|nr:amino acid adenylation domain-containing protein [Halanaerobiales bacterium]